MQRLRAPTPDCPKCAVSSPVSSISARKSTRSSNSTMHDDKRRMGASEKHSNSFRKTKKRRALVCVQAFPPLLKNAGGVAMRYLTLCRSLIDDLGWDVTLVTPVHVARSGNADVERWLRTGRLSVVPARGVRVTLKDGVAMFLDVFSIVNTFWFFHLLIQHRNFDVCIMDDIPWRLNLIMLMRSFFNIPCIVTTHTDATRLEGYRHAAFKFVWKAHMWSARLADCHATVSSVFGKILAARERTPVNGVWPFILWSHEFRRTRHDYRAEGAMIRKSWIEMLGFEPKMIFLFVGRWAKEKRIHLLFDAIPAGCALVVCGDSTSVYANDLASGKLTSDNAERAKSVLLLRGILKAREMRSAYAACDMLVSASDFETLGNTVIESLASGTPVAVQPAQGHLELVRDEKNSYLVDYADAETARAKLGRIARRFCRETKRLDDAAKKECHGDDPCDRRWARMLPDLGKTCTELRCSRFGEKFESSILRPIIHAEHRSRSCCGDVGRVLMRLVLGIVWLLTWIVLRTITRTAFMISPYPKFEVLGELGSSIESEKDDASEAAAAKGDS